MVDARVVAGIVVVLVIVLLVVFWPFGKGPAGKTTATTVVSSSTGNTLAATTTVAGPVKVEYYVINYQWVYSGPAQQGSTYCYYTSHTNYQGYSQVLNGSQSFYINLLPGSGQCSYKIVNISASTPGFVVTSVNPALPYYLPPSSGAELQVTIRAPSVNYFGPLTLTINYN